MTKQSCKTSALQPVETWHKIHCEFPHSSEISGKCGLSRHDARSRGLKSKLGLVCACQEASGGQTTGQLQGRLRCGQGNQAGWWCSLALRSTEEWGVCKSIPRPTGRWSLLKLKPRWSEVTKLTLPAAASSFDGLKPELLVTKLKRAI